MHAQSHYQYHSCLQHLHAISNIRYSNNLISRLTKLIPSDNFDKYGYYVKCSFPGTFYQNDYMLYFTVAKLVIAGFPGTSVYIDVLHMHATINCVVNTFLQTRGKSVVIVSICFPREPLLCCDMRISKILVTGQ